METPLETATSTVAAAADPQDSMMVFHAAPLESRSGSTLVSVVGISASLPAGIMEGGEFEAIDGSVPIPEVRWDPDRQGWLTGDRAVRFAGLIKDTSFFDADAFWIAEKEAMLMDPQQRLVLETVGDTIAQFNESVNRSSCGVFVGCSSQDYLKLSLGLTGITAYTGTGTSSSVISGRLSFTFGFQGPALTIDTACSSSLVSMHMAFNCLNMHQCETASASGANLLLHPSTLATLQKAGMLTPDGRCKILNATADGYVRAEAVGSLLLHSGEVKLSDCMSFVAGSCVNQDGRSSALTAPNGPAQATVVRSALEVSSISADDVSALQMHGTGTALGDPIEIGGAQSALIGSARKVPLVLMASKSWMGHAEPAAGIAGVVQAQLASAAKVALPILHLRSMNSHVTAAIGPSRMFYIPKTHSAGMGISVVGTSAFAFQGTNAHIIMASTDKIGNTRPKSLGSSKVLSLQRKHYWLVPSCFRYDKVKYEHYHR